MHCHAVIVSGTRGDFTFEPVIVVSSSFLGAGAARGAVLRKHRSAFDEIDHDALGAALLVGDGNSLAIPRVQLLEQWQRIVIRGAPT